MSEITVTRLVLLDAVVSSLEEQSSAHCAQFSAGTSLAGDTERLSQSKLLQNTNTELSSTWSIIMAGTNVQQLLSALLSTDNETRSRAEVRLHSI